MERSGKLDGKTYCFGDYRFIPNRQLLMLGDKPLRVGARALDLLHLLLIHAGEVVGKDQLMSFVWPDTFVHESNLKVNIAALRRALRQEASGLSCIATVSGRGYRFVAPLRVYGRDHSPLAFDSGMAPARELPNIAPIIGRDQVITALEAKLATERLVTVVGPAGVGKTTVALATAGRLPKRYGDGVCFVDLATIGDPQLVDAAIAASLGVSGKWTNVLAGIVETLRHCEMLLVLDNCEHVLSTASAIAEHLGLALPNIRIIATSREPLRSRCENVYRLSPLPYPDGNGSTNRKDALAFAAVELFVRKAHEACGYVLDDMDAPTVTAICRRLDGIPLAIELAASRLATMNLATLLGLLERSFEPLNSGPRKTLPRHQTLLATLDWSYQLLSADEARLLRLLSVFSANFFLSDVIGVGGSIEEIAACTENLAAKSLLSVAYDTGVPRYRLLDSTRSFAAERLIWSGEAADAQSNHARHLLRLFEQAELEWQWQPRNQWTATYEPRFNDLLKAIDWTLGEGADPEVGVRLTSAAIPLWDELSTVAESRRRVERALQSVEALSRCDPAVKMKLIASYASGLNFSDHLGHEADAAWMDANQLAQEIGNIDYQLRTLWGLGILQSFTGRHRQAITTLRQFAELASGENERAVIAEGERVRLMAAFYCGEVRFAYDDLKKLVREHAATAKQSGVARFQMDRYVSIRVALAMTAWVAGDRSEATTALQDALDHSLALGHLVSHSNALAQAALPIALWSGETETARRHVEFLARNLTLRDIAIWRPVCHFYEGAVRSMDGDSEGVDVMQLAIRQLVANNFIVRVPVYLTILAEAALCHKRFALARDSLSFAFDRAERQGEYWSQPELQRVRGLLQWRDGDLSGASETLLLATETARESGALFFRLRASTSLAELWSETNRHRAAADLLSPVCAQFDNVPPCATVAKARHLLDTLRR
ncbi:ATP-binding protein [Phyllobacterium endophyticum]|uniref:Transcriptional regulator n=1 Tax=Phyllobacterium endophyticum TaxID=1149773 RepID=A0A2P7ARD3_9HYPH|nr:winged helix-turn-helix domain-containing protein [Phyllobacterium endophyticum]MBB3237467.1 putative ATPase/DNA-binding winged helix-turn-helix (wHTH) protein [Phyllobacterium endophyticum]PSH56794.1 transcriptional regulator [Phyllobacterium endophyticum]TYR44223.1 AAA family ATPase [Phyllobacterium endophyticum]